MLKPSAPQFHIIHSRKALNLFHSGQGAGKTHAMGVIAYQFIMNAPKSLGFIAANTYEQLTKSTLLEVYRVWKNEFHFIEGRDFVSGKKPPDDFAPNDVTLESYTNTISCRNGALIFIGSLENYKAHDGKTLAWAMLDETKDTREEAVKDVIIARLRQKGLYCNEEANIKEWEFPYSNDPGKGVPQNPLYIFTSPAKVQWLSEMFDLESHRVNIKSTIYSKDDFFYHHDGNKCVVISSTYHNAHNLPPGYIENRLDILTPEKIDMNIYGSPFGKTGAEYYSAFNHDKHIKPLRMKGGLPLHLSFDFNVNPYMPAILIEIIGTDHSEDGRMKVKVIDEFALEAPRNTIEDVCSQFRAEYGHLCNSGLFYYGDATGKNRVPVKETRTYFQVIRKALHGIASNSSERVLSQNPRHQAIGKQTLGRRDFMNACLKGAYGFDLLIDPKCKNLIADLQFIKEDANGAKLKEKAEINGVKAEKYGHMSDALDAVLCYVFEKYWR